MEDQHEILCKTLWKNYFLRILPGFIAFTAIFLYFSRFFTVTYVEYPIQVSSSASTFKSIIKATQLSLNTLNKALSQQILSYNKSGVSSNVYCTSNLTFEQCQTSINFNTLNELIQDRLNTSVSFRCVVGSCFEAAVLYDYFWTFKARNQFIDYILLEYVTGKSSKSKLLVPSLANATSYQIQVGPEDWLLSYRNSQVCLSSQYSDSNISAMACFDSDFLQSKYKIVLDDFDLDSGYSFSGQPVISLLNTMVQANRFEVIPLNLTIFVGLITVLLFNHLQIIKIVTSWEQNNFKHIQALESIYREQLKQIFSQRQPRNSAILNEKTLEYFYEDLSEMVDGSYCSLSEHDIQEEQLQKFKYLGLLQRIKTKFQREMKVIEKERVSQISDIRYQLKVPVGEISDNVAKRLKQTFARAKELHLTSAFFYYGYLCLLIPVDRYQERLQSQSYPLPQSMLSLFRYMNHSAHSEDIKFAFKFAYSSTKNIEEQLVMRLHFSLHQKYLALVKELDFGAHFATKLGFSRQLKYLEESIENQKYILSSYLK